MPGIFSTNVNETFHEVQFIFNRDSRLAIYAGNEELLPNNIYNFTVGDYETDQVREFTIIGHLKKTLQVQDIKYNSKLV